jgi:hypothetical protein
VGETIKQGMNSSIMTSIKKTFLVLEKCLNCINDKAVHTSLFEDQRRMGQKKLAKAIKVYTNKIKYGKKNIVYGVKRTLVQILSPVMGGVKRDIDYNNINAINPAEKFFCHGQENRQAKNRFYEIDWQFSSYLQRAGSMDIYWFQRTSDN